MTAFRLAIAIFFFAMLGACSTTQEVHVAKYGSIKPINSVSQVARGGPAQLDRNLVFLSEFSAG